MLTKAAHKTIPAYKRLTLILLVSLCLICCGHCRAAFAHKLFMFTSFEGDVVHGRVYFSASVPLSGGVIFVKNDKGEQLATLKSDEAGKFVLPLTEALRAGNGSGEGNLHIVCQTIDGHKAERVIKFVNPEPVPIVKTIENKQLLQADGSVSLGNVTAQSGTITKEDLHLVVAAELRPLKEQIDLLHSKIWLRDILGGIGFLFGIFGLWMFVVSNRRLDEARRLSDGGGA